MDADRQRDARIAEKPERERDEAVAQAKDWKKRAIAIMAERDEAREQLAAQVAERLRADAERYAYLRNTTDGDLGHPWCCIVNVEGVRTFLFDTRLDDAIDAARKEQPDAN